MSRTPRYILLDRDGTIIEERSYLHDPDGVILLPRSIDGLRAMRRLGYGLAVVTNQSGVGRGFYDIGKVHDVNRRMIQLLGQAGVTIDGIFICPHHPDDRCLCRKPNPGLVHQAAKSLGFNPMESFVIGDKDVDIGLGHHVGAKTILVRTGHGQKHSRLTALRPDFIVDDLVQAAEKIAQYKEAVP